MKHVYIVTALMIIGVLTVVYIIYTSSPHQSSTIISSNTSSTEIPTTSPSLTTKSSLSSSSKTTLEIEPATLYKIATYYEEVVFKVTQYNSSFDNIVDEIRFGLKRINISEGGIVYIDLFIENKTTRIIDFTIGLRENDTVVKAGGKVNGNSINGINALKYANNLVNQIKSLIFYEVLYGDQDMIIEEINARVSKNPEFNITSITKRKITISAIDFNAVQVVLKSINPSNKILNKTFVFAEVLPNTWTTVKLKIYYEDNMFQIYELIKIVP